MRGITILGLIMITVAPAWAQEPASPSPSPAASPEAAASPTPASPSPEVVDQVPGDEEEYQALYISKDLADKALPLVKPGSTIRSYCAYCPEKDPGFHSEVVEEVEVVQDEESDKWALSVNGADLDLASTYIEHEGQWKNLAHLVKASLKDVPEVLPADVIEMKEDQEDEEEEEEEAEEEEDEEAGEASPSPADGK